MCHTCILISNALKSFECNYGYCIVQMDDAIHLGKFNHDCSRDLEVNISKLKCIPSQNLDFFLVLDLEGRVEILEFPVLMINAKTMEVRDFFHRFVKYSFTLFCVLITLGTIMKQKKRWTFFSIIYLFIFLGIRKR